MDLNATKQLEDAKEELSKLHQKLNNKRDNIEMQFCEESIEAFKKFFTQQNFTIKEYPYTVGRDGVIKRTISANYRHCIISLKIPSIEECYVGALSTWELDVPENNQKYLLLVREIGKKYGVKISIVSKNENKATDEEIVRVKQEIEEVQDQLNKSEEIKLCFDVKLQDRTQQEELIFPSMMDLLNNLFQTK